jgi:hypothetical protein
MEQFRKLTRRVSRGKLHDLDGDSDALGEVSRVPARVTVQGILTLMKQTGVLRLLGRSPILVHVSDCVS